MYVTETQRTLQATEKGMQKYNNVAGGTRNIISLKHSVILLKRILRLLVIFNNAVLPDF